MPRILLVRHGPSAHVHTGGAIDHAGVLAWRAAYDAAGITPGSNAPPELTHRASGATHIIASDLPRAVESARRIAPDREIMRSELLRESILEIPHWPTRLPLGAWGTLIYLAWGLRIVRGREVAHAERARAVAAADWLLEIVSGDAEAVVVTHGVFRRLLADELLRRDWVMRRENGYRHWSTWSFTPP